MLDLTTASADHDHMTVTASSEGLGPSLEAVELAMNDHPVTVTVREVRKALKLKQEDFARLWGVPVSIVSQIEAGRKVNPSWETLRKLVVNVGCHPSSLFPEPPDRRVGEA